MIAWNELSSLIHKQRLIKSFQNLLNGWKSLNSNKTGKQDKDFKSIPALN